MTVARRHRPAPRLAPFSLRLSPEERVFLELKAGNQPLAAYIKTVLLTGEDPRRRMTRPRTDHQMLARVLAALGASQLSASLERLSYAARDGALHVDERLRAKLDAACDDIRAMHLHLLKALGKRLPKMPPPDQRLGVTFAQAAQDDDGGWP